MPHFIACLCAFVTRYSSKPAFLIKQLEMVKAIIEGQMRGKRAWFGSLLHDSVLEVVDGTALLDKEDNLVAIKAIDEVVSDLKRGVYVVEA
jgi:hypothetical protein